MYASEIRDFRAEYTVLRDGDLGIFGDFFRDGDFWKVNPWLGQNNENWLQYQSVV